MILERLSKYKMEKEDEHALEIKEMIAELKISVVEAIREAKNKLAEDLENAGSWNMNGWCESLAPEN